MNVLRIFRIIWILAKYRLDRNIPDVAKTIWIRLLTLPLKLIPPRNSEAQSARLAIEELGPIFIKLGQLLSTRKDLFTEDMSDELSKLQDQVPPFDSDLARRLIEAQLGAPIEKYFEAFDTEALASASVAQVHCARLREEHTGPDNLDHREVIIKVIRPGIDTTIREDISLMYTLARLLERFWSDAKRLHPVAIVADYEHTILNELNLMHEADNTVRIRENWYNSGKLYVPQILEQFSTSKIMVMERIYGVTATDMASLNAKETNLQKLAHLGVEIFFTQVFEDNFFHADMHPGNVFVDISDPENPTYIALDCAIIGSLTENDKNYLAKNLLAFFNRDYEEVARLHVHSGWVPRDTNVDEFASVIRRVVDPYFQKQIKDISFGNVLLELFQTARQFNMEVQPQLVLLQKTLINIEGMGRQIYPELDLWETAAPFMQRWMEDRIGVSGLLRRITKNAPRWLDQLPEIPDLALNAMLEVKALSDTNREQRETLIEVHQTLQHQVKRSRYQRLGALALIAALLSVLFPVSGYAAVDPVIPGSILGSLGIYWMYIHS